MNPRGVIGYDARLASPEMARAFASGFMDGGGAMTSIGMVSSEYIYFICGKESDRYDVGAMITASHNPPEYNGCKFVHGGAVPFTGADLQFLKDFLLASSLPESPYRDDVEQRLEIRDIREDYADHMMAISPAKSLPPTEQETLRIVVAAGNGVGARAFAPIAERLAQRGVQTIWLDPEPDGRFPNGTPNPLLPSYVSRLAAKVLECKADLGIGFDGDADRAGFVAEDGLEVTGSQVLAMIMDCKQSLMADMAEAQPKLVFRNICCSQLVSDHAAGLSNIEIMDTPVGHGQIKQLMRHEALRSRVIFAGEHSGHFYYPEFYFVDSGTLSSLYLIYLAMRCKTRNTSIGKMAAPWRGCYHWSTEINYEFPKDPEGTPMERRLVNQVFQKLGNAFSGHGFRREEIRKDAELGLCRAFPAEGSYDLVHQEVPDLKVISAIPGERFWMVVRPSGNEPVLRVNIETMGTDKAAFCRELTAFIDQQIAFLSGYRARRK